jgi:hypothetical protein
LGIFDDLIFFQRYDAMVKILYNIQDSPVMV